MWLVVDTWPTKGQPGIDLERFISRWNCSIVDVKPGTEWGVAMNDYVSCLAWCFGFIFFINLLLWFLCIFYHSWKELLKLWPVYYPDNHHKWRHDSRGPVFISEKRFVLSYFVLGYFVEFQFIIMNYDIACVEHKKCLLGISCRECV